MRRSAGNERLVPKVLASAADGVVNLIDRYGGDIESIFCRANISPTVLEDPLNELGLREYCNLFDTVAMQVGEDHFGLLFGASFKPNRLGGIGYLAVNSPTLHAALNNFVHYFPVHQDSTYLNVVEDRGIYRLDYEILDPNITNATQDAELSIGIFLNILKHGLGSHWGPLEVHFSHRNFHHSASKHEAIFQCPVRFNQASNSILFHKSALNAIMPDCDPYLYTVIESTLKRSKEVKSETENLVDEVKHQIKVSLGGSVPKVSEIAATFNLDVAHVKRKLDAHGVRYSDLLRAARQELAIKYLAQTDMPLTEVAFSLGYSELSAFSRAFKAWSGMCPQRYRNSHLLS
ncbi:AraC family transcriptional regulator [Vibrio sp. S9_S30]|uniref:AraC-like transcriptional regulator QhpR n=1 Tax=Vibrio sp. S9_S30 TaxID=2720226 RepID=UPI0016818100|nr:AraC family transcriptional regulator [Vibrio sp. S9_S30]MBD1558152.1 AraC family transcriptional regulator [Vibrio sp. S9_S30]